MTRTSSPPGAHNPATIPNVKAEMARNSLSQSKLAERTGMSQIAVSRRLTGQVPFTVDELFMFADAFGCSVEDLIRKAPATGRSAKNIPAAGHSTDRQEGEA